MAEEAKERARAHLNRRAEVLCEDAEKMYSALLAHVADGTCTSETCRERIHTLVEQIEHRITGKA